MAMGFITSELTLTLSLIKREGAPPLLLKRRQGGVLIV